VKEEVIIGLIMKQRLMALYQQLKHLLPNILV